MLAAENLTKHRGLEPQWGPKFMKQICDGRIALQKVNKGTFYLLLIRYMTAS